MENYIIGFLPVVKPTDDMKIEVGLSGGVYSVPIGDLKKYFSGETGSTAIGGGGQP